LTAKVRTINEAYSFSWHIGLHDMFNNRLEAGYNSFSLVLIVLMETNILLGPVSELMKRSRLFQSHVLFSYLIALFINSLYKLCCQLL